MTFSVQSSYTKIQAIVERTPNDVLPSSVALAKAEASLPLSLPAAGLGEETTEAHLLSDLVPGFNGPKTSANYYGFVTGGVFPIAEVADNIVTAFDQNVQVHLPNQSISTVVEDRALSMLAELLDLHDGWIGRTFTTGATGANILGLACGREAVVNARLEALELHEGVGELGLLAACLKAGIKEIQVLTSMAHSSLFKAASIVGLGRSSVKNLPFSAEEPWRLDLAKLEQELKRSEQGVVSIVALSAGEVNTGMFAMEGAADMKKTRQLCDNYKAWLHVDGAFGIFARALPRTSEFSRLIDSTSGIEFADSIAGDGHKMLNVPYDCGFFFTRSADILPLTFQNPNATYLSSGPSGSSIPSPLNIGLENSRRFRALPVYATLLAYGRNGFAEMFARQVRLARDISQMIEASDYYELLPGHNAHAKNDLEKTHIIVIFRAKDETLNDKLVMKINATRKMYVSGTKWAGSPACRIAVSTWKVDVERDSKLIQKVLEEVST